MMTDCDTVLRSYSVTPRTRCLRMADGSLHIFHFTSGKDARGAYGFLRGGSYKLPGGKWVRTYEHPQEWSDCG
jgi:hypothetical protein